MKKIFIILLLGLLGCVVHRPPGPDLIVYYEGTLIKVEEISTGYEGLEFKWTILTEAGDTIVRYVFRVPNYGVGATVPYFDYKK